MNKNCNNCKFGGSVYIYKECKDCKFGAEKGLNDSWEEREHKRDCDIFMCDSEGDNQLAGFQVWLCGNHWFNIMNGVSRPPEYLQDIHDRRVKELEK